VPVGPTGQDSSARRTWAPLNGPPSMGSRFTRWVSKPSLPVGVQSFARWVSKSSYSRVSVNSLGVGERDQWVSTIPAMHARRRLGRRGCPRLLYPSYFSGCPRNPFTNPAAGLLRQGPPDTLHWVSTNRFIHQLF
jgi:hypothetical protein